MNKELAGRCGNCGNRLEFRQSKVRDNGDDPKSKIICWLVMGMCQKCEVIYMQHILKQEHEPLLDDFHIRWDKDAVGEKEPKFASQQEKEE